jgi:hypothetical protein
VRCWLIRVQPPYVEEEADFTGGVRGGDFDDNNETVPVPAIST